MKKFFVLISLMVMSFVANAAENAAEVENYYLGEIFGRITNAEVTKTVAENGMDYVYTVCIHTTRCVLPAIIIRNGELEIVWEDRYIGDNTVNGFWWDGYKWQAININQDGCNFVYNTSAHDPFRVSPSFFFKCGDEYADSIHGPYTVKVTDGVLILLREDVAIAKIK